MQDEQNCYVVVVIWLSGDKFPSLKQVCPAELRKFQVSSRVYNNMDSIPYSTCTLIYL